MESDRRPNHDKKHSVLETEIGEVTFVENSTISKIACGKEHVVALDVKGHVWTWGVNGKG